MPDDKIAKARTEAHAYVSTMWPRLTPGSVNYNKKVRAHRNKLLGIDPKAEQAATRALAQRNRQTIIDVFEQAGQKLARRQAIERLDLNARHNAEQHALAERKRRVLAGEITIESIVAAYKPPTKKE